MYAMQFMFIGGIYYKLFNLFSFLFSTVYISSCITCLYAYMLEINTCIYVYIVYANV